MVALGKKVSDRERRGGGKVNLVKIPGKMISSFH